MLHHTLSRLLEIGDWRKLGGRLQLKENGRPEIHVPRTFTSERPAVAFTHEALFEMRINEHPAARHLPKPTDGPSIQPISVESQFFAEEVPPIVGARKDILWAAENPNDEAKKAILFSLERKRLKGPGLARFLFRYMWDRFWNPAWKRRMIFLPREVFALLQSLFQQEPKSRPITVASFLNARFRLPRLLKSEGVYVQNMTLLAYTFLSSQLARGPVGPIALTHRRHLIEQTTEQQLHSFLQIVRKDIESRRRPRLYFGESVSLAILLNSLTKADLIKVADFGAAVLSQGENTESRNNPPGTMVTYYNLALTLPSGSPNGIHFSVETMGRTTGSWEISCHGHG
ncbi:hypothetical protein GJ744_001517 [Endocarpon pusillum]|uniref:Uncharacterized protein n=1 Tax=Endocarpon pusillum TaxID=364733 RepID=A0A8H7AD98_9EURO|nr:hypothetical protein GJ744_001517 [Endocarpon pusillum]